MSSYTRFGTRPFAVECITVLLFQLTENAPMVGFMDGLTVGVTAKYSKNMEIYPMEIRRAIKS